MGERKGSQRAWEFSFRSLPHSETSADPGRSQQVVEDGPGPRTMGHAISRRTLSALDVGAQKNVRVNCNLGMARSHISASWEDDRSGSWPVKTPELFSEVEFLSQRLGFPTM